MEINSQGIWNLTSAKTVPMPHQGAPEFCSLFCHRVQLLALCRVNSNSQSWIINCTIETVWKTNNGSTIQFDAENSVPKVDCCFHAILFVHLSYFPYFCIHFLVQISVSCCYLSLLKMCFQWCLHNNGSFSTDWHSAWVSIMWSVRKVKRRTWGKWGEKYN